MELRGIDRVYRVIPGLRNLRASEGLFVSLWPLKRVTVQDVGFKV